jgi:hypothetical protein
MTDDQLIETMRHRGFYLDLDSLNTGESKSTYRGIIKSRFRYAARFWKQAHDVEVRYEFANTLSDVIFSAFEAYVEREPINE